MSVQRSEINYVTVYKYELPCSIIIKNMPKGKTMNFTDFQTRTKVIKRFNLKFRQENFLQEKKFKISDERLEDILDNFRTPRVFHSEYSICEALIFPIISVVAKKNRLPVWSHYRLIDKKNQLEGIPDYLFALAEEGGEEYKTPIACLGEAKKDNFEKGWAQVAATMVAVQTINGLKESDITVFGFVTNAQMWQFAMLNKDVFTFDNTLISATSQFYKTLNILNWLFSECRQNLDIIIEMEKNKK